MVIDESVYLEHFGVKGMRWGVKKQAVAGLQRFSQDRDSRIGFVSREISKKEYSSLKSTPIKLSDSDGIFKRISEEKQAQFRDFVYVTKDGQDHTNYIALFSSGGVNNNKTKYSMTIKTSEAVISPGLKERVDIFVKTLGQSIPNENNSSIIKGRQYVVGNQEPSALKVLSNRELGLRYYQTFAQQQHNNTPLTKAYIKNVKERGYNSLIDDADVGLMSEVPMIIFPKEAGARVIEVRKISKKEKLKAQTTLSKPKLLSDIVL
jgi:hypothetical protein